MVYEVERGEIYLADLDPIAGSEQGGVRPVLIIQNDIVNYISTTTIIACLTSHFFKKIRLPTHVLVKAKNGLTHDSIVMLEQIKTIDKSRIIRRIGKLSQEEMKQVNKCILVSIGVASKK